MADLIKIKKHFIDSIDDNIPEFLNFYYEYVVGCGIQSTKSNLSDTDYCNPSIDKKAINIFNRFKAFFQKYKRTKYLYDPEQILEINQQSLEM